MKKTLLLLSALAISSCASIIEGSTQNINVSLAPNTPSYCTAKSEDFSTGFAAPGTVSVPKSMKPLEITCAPQDGSAAGTVKVLSDVAGWGYGGAALTLGVGAVVDSATGAANKYPDNVTVVLGQSSVIGQSSMNSNADFNK